MESRSLWKRSLCRLARSGALTLVLLSPYTIEHTASRGDSSATEIQFGLGGGSMERVLSRDCSGEPTNVRDVPFAEGGAAIAHTFSGVRVGAKVDVVPSKVIAFSDPFAGGSGVMSGLFPGIADTTSRTTVFLNPTIGVNLKNVGLDVGGLVDVTHQSKRVVPTGRLRLGNPVSGFATIGFGANLPMMTGGGFLDFGFGGNVGKPGMDFWGGLGWGPYSGTVLSAKQNIPLSRNFVLNLNGLINFSQRVQFGLAAGGTIKF
jgi:hypothetical protein